MNTGDDDDVDVEDSDNDFLILVVATVAIVSISESLCFQKHSLLGPKQCSIFRQFGGNRSPSGACNFGTASVKQRFHK